MFDSIHKIVADKFFDPATAGSGLAGRPHTIPTAGRQRSDARSVRRGRQPDAGPAAHLPYALPHTGYAAILRTAGRLRIVRAYADQIARVREDVPQHEIGYVGIGIDTLVTEEGTFILSVYDGLPADQAGLQVGDRLVSVDGRAVPSDPLVPARDGQDVR